MTLDAEKRQGRTADFSTAAAKCAASGRNDGLWVGKKEETGNCGFLRRDNVFE
jgi:hypothetical protein